MSALATTDIIGTWRVVRTELPAPYDPEHEFFHFSPNGVHAWEHPFLKQSLRVFQFLYTITDSGVRLTKRNGEASRDLPMRLDGELLVITGSHGYSSWLRRLNTAERPPYLSQFHEPPDLNRNG